MDSGVDVLPPYSRQLIDSHIALIASALATAFVVDRGHRFSNGTSWVCFWLSPICRPAAGGAPPKVPLDDGNDGRDGVGGSLGDGATVNASWASASASSTLRTCSAALSGDASPPDKKARFDCVGEEANGIGALSPLCSPTSVVDSEEVVEEPVSADVLAIGNLMERARSLSLALAEQEELLETRQTQLPSLESKQNSRQLSRDELASLVGLREVILHSFDSIASQRTQLSTFCNGLDEMLSKTEGSSGDPFVQHRMEFRSLASRVGDHARASPRPPTSKTSRPRAHTPKKKR